MQTSDTARPRGGAETCARAPADPDPVATAVAELRAALDAIPRLDASVRAALIERRHGPDEKKRPGRPPEAHHQVVNERAKNALKR